MPIYCPPFSRHGPHIYTDRGKVIYHLDFAPQFTLSDPTHIGGLIFHLIAIRQLCGSRGGTSGGVFLRSDINMGSSNWRDGEICELLTIAGKDCAIYEKVPEVLSLRGFCRDKHKGKNKEYVGVFTLVNSLSCL